MEVARHSIARGRWLRELWCVHGRYVWVRRRRRRVVSVGSAEGDSRGGRSPGRCLLTVDCANRGFVARLGFWRGRVVVWQRRERGGRSGSVCCTFGVGGSRMLVDARRIQTERILGRYGRRDVWTLGNGEVGTSVPQKASGGLRLLLREPSAVRGRALALNEPMHKPRHHCSPRSPDPSRSLAHSVRLTCTSLILPLFWDLGPPPTLSPSSLAALRR